MNTELVVLSGKGGTGKTGIAASLALLAGECVLVDCDVDAPNLALVFPPEVEREESFSSGRMASIRPDDCTACGRCIRHCRFEAIRLVTNGSQAPHAKIDPYACEGCGVCVRMCPEGAIAFDERVSGTWYVSHARTGAFVHARLFPGGENSGKLVGKLRAAAKSIAETRKAAWTIVDGSPGIGCQVISSITGTDRAIVVTEPTRSALHDLDRIMQLLKHFDIPTYVCVNKWDINPGIAAEIEAFIKDAGGVPVGKIRYDERVATHCSSPPLEVGGTIAREIELIWRRIEEDCKA